MLGGYWRKGNEKTSKVMPEVRWIDNTSAVEVWRTLGSLFRRFQLWQNTQKSCHKTEKQENKRKLVNHPEKTTNWVCGADIFIKREETKITDRESVIFFIFLKKKFNIFDNCVEIFVLSFKVENVLAPPTFKWSLLWQVKVNF